MQVGELRIKLGLDMSEYTRGLDQARGRVGDIIKALGVFELLRRGVDLVKSSMDRAFARIDTMERFRSTMTVLTGDTRTAETALSAITDTVKGTAYALDTAAMAVQNFVTRGVDINNATSYIQAWGDAVAFYGRGTDESLANVTDALSKMLTTGKVHMDQLNRLFLEGIPAVDIYADATGMSADAVQEALSKGHISAQTFVDVVTKALEEGTARFPALAGAAKEAGASWAAVWGNMRIAVARGVAAIITSIDEALQDNQLPTMREMVKQFGETFEAMLKRVASVIPPIIERIAAIKAALEPFAPIMADVGIFVASFVTSMATLNKVIEVARSVWLAFTVVLNANPIMLVTAAIAALIATGTLVYLHWDQIKEWLSATWQSIATTAQTVWNGIVTFFSSIWDGVTSSFQAAWNSITVGVTAAWNAIAGVFQSAWSTIGQIVSAGWSNMKAIFSAEWNTIKSVVSAAWEAIKIVFASAFLTIYYLVTGQWDKIGEVFKAAGEKLKGIVLGLWENVKKIWGDAFQTVSQNTSIAWDAIKKLFTDAWTAVKNTVSGAWDSIKKWFIDAGENVKTTVSNMWNGVVNYFREAPGKIMSVMSNLSQSISSVWMSLKDGAIDAGRNMILGLIDGIRSFANRAVDAARKVVNDAVQAAKNLLGIKSPSRVFMEIGQYTSQGLAVGIDDGARLAVASVSSMIDEVKRAAVQMVQVNVSGTALAVTPVGSPGGADVPIVIQQMVVRSDDDIRRIARELYLLQQARGRAAGWAR